MQGLFFETDTGVKLFIRALVVLLGFWTAWRTGRAGAEGWGEFPTVVVYTFGLGIAMRFLHHALFNGPFLDLYYYVIDVAVLLVFAWLGFRTMRTTQMVNNYYWLYERASAISWKKKD